MLCCTSYLLTSTAIDQPGMLTRIKKLATQAVTMFPPGWNHQLAQIPTAPSPAYIFVVLEQEGQADMEVDCYNYRDRYRCRKKRRTHCGELWLLDSVHSLYGN